MIRCFNNWAKGALADVALRGLKQREMEQWRRARLAGDAWPKPESAARSLRILDVAGGKGSGLLKWRQPDVKVAEYTLVDISPASLAAAQHRLRGLKTTMRAVRVRTVCLDATEPPPGFRLPAPAHIATLHFGINYMAHSEEELRRVFRFVGANVARDGLLIVTFLNWSTVESRLAAAAARGSSGTRLRGELFDLQLSSRAADDTGFGVRQYTFTLPGCVEACLECPLRLDWLAATALDEGWLPMVMLGDLFALKRDARFSTAVPRALTQAEREAVSLYGCAIFRTTKAK